MKSSLRPTAGWPMCPSTATPAWASPAPTAATWSSSTLPRKRWSATSTSATASAPTCPIFGPKDGLLYVTTELDQTITIIDPKTLKIVGTIPTGQPQSHMLALSHDGRRGYTANVGPGTVSVLDIPARKTLKIIPISGNTQRISISNDDRWVFTADQTKPQLAVIDTATNTVDKLGPARRPRLRKRAHPRWPLAADRHSRQEQGGRHRPEDHAGRRSRRGLRQTRRRSLVRPDGKVAYVSCTGSNQVAEIDLATWKVTRLDRHRQRHRRLGLGGREIDIDDWADKEFRFEGDETQCDR